ncbi:Pet127-domain-containing protein [Nemania sp. FL0916]|nr:Pet127-domain-containing protein [Nemania sp. FL0916]
MLQLGRRRLCRLNTSSICAACLATSRLSPSITRHSVVAGHHVRLLSTTIARRDATTAATTPAAASSSAPADITPPPPKQEKQETKKAKKAKTKAKKSGGTKPSKSGDEQRDTDANRQLKVLQGALEALQNVLHKRGIDVSHIPGVTSPAHESPKSEAKTEGKAEAGGKAKSKAKAKAKAKTQDKKGKASETAATQKAADGAVESAGKEVKEVKKVKKVKEPKDVKEAKDVNEAKEAKPGPETSTEPPTKQKSTGRKVKVAHRTTKPAKKAQKQQKAPPSAAKPANLGVPFGATATPFSSQQPSKSKKSASKQKTRDPIARINPHQLSLVPIDAPRPEVPPLSYGLERVLFNAGIYTLQDPRTRVFNFDPYLSQIMPVDEFDFNALKQYVTSSKDNRLIGIAKEHQKKYTGSTSSMTSMLAHFHYLLSAWRDVDTSMLSQSFQPESRQYTRIMKAPAAIFLHWKDGTYAIDADKEFDTASILSMLGKSMEKLLTLSTDEYERYRRGSANEITEEERNAEEAFHYTGFQDFMMRSQLDAHDPRMPGTGMFDLKTRAVISIRMDAQGYHKGLGYEIRKRFGLWESFEREYFDMIRSAFLKYSLQVRMGRMDGIFVAFHNTQRIFGFQYIPLTEMDVALHGHDNHLVGDQEFKISLKLLNELLDRATKKWPERSLRLHFETRPSVGTPFMYFFAKPTTDEEIAEVQNAGRASVDEFEREILGLVKHAAEDEAAQPVKADDTNEVDPDQAAAPPAEEVDTLTAWQEARQMVEEAMDDDEVGAGAVKEAIADALEQSGILRAQSLAESQEYVSALLGALTESTEADATAIDASEEATLDEDEPEGKEVETSVDGNEEDSHPDSTEQEVPSTSPANDVHPDQSAQDARSVQHHDSQITPQTQPVEASEGLSLTSDHENDATEISIEPKDSEEEIEQENEDEEESDTELEAKEASEDLGSPSLEPLKSLIVRMARRIDEQAVSDAYTDNAQDDASKLQEFERILGRLISESRTDQPQGTSTDDLADQGQPDSHTVANELDEIASTSDGRDAETTEQAVKDSSLSGERPIEPELLGLTLTIKNKVNDRYISRPNKLEQSDKWTVEYEIQEVEGARAQKIYEQTKLRRRRALESVDKDAEWYKMWQGALQTLSQSGREFREEETRIMKDLPVHILGNEEPLRWEDVFWRQLKNTETAGENTSEQQDEARAAEEKVSS